MPTEPPAPPRHGDWSLITAFARRRDLFKRWLLAAVFGATVLAMGGYVLTAVGVLLLFPLYGALKHLRCPGCDGVTSLKGVADGHHCRYCGQRLHY